MSSVIFMEGFELYNGSGANLGLAGNGYVMGYSPQDLITTGRFGGQCLNINGGGGTEDTVKTFWGTALSTLTVGFAFKAGGTSWNIMELRNGTSTNCIAINSTATGALEVRRGSRSGTVLGTSPAGVAPSNTWIYIELSLTISATVGTVDLNVDGLSQISLTAQNTGTTSIDSINFCENSAGGQSYFDDVYVRDDLTRLGPSRIESLIPNSDVSGGVWTPSTGTSGWACIDETQANGDTDYISASSVGDQSLFECTDLSTTPLNVYAVQIVTNSEKTDAATRAIKHAISDGTTTATSGDKALLSAYGFQNTIFLTAPDGSAWNGTKVNALKAGVKVSV